MGSGEHGEIPLGATSSERRLSPGLAPVTTAAPEPPPPGAAAAYLRRVRERWVAGRNRTPVVLIGLALLAGAGAGVVPDVDDLPAGLGAGAMALAGMGVLLGRPAWRLAAARAMPIALAVVWVASRFLLRGSSVEHALMGFMAGWLLGILVAWALDPEWLAIYRRANRKDERPLAERLLKKRGPNP